MKGLLLLELLHALPAAGRLYKAVASVLDKPGLSGSGLETTVVAGGLPGDFSQS